MTSTNQHSNWKRPKGLAWNITEDNMGWEAIIDHDGETTNLPIQFATEELAIKAAKAIVDYAYGPAGIDLSKTKVKPKEADEKPKTRKAPKQKKKESASAAGGN